MTLFIYDEESTHYNVFLNMLSLMMLYIDALISLARTSYQGSEDSPVVEISVNVVGTLETTVSAT
jgi:hypothetical protein